MLLRSLIALACHRVSHLLLHLIQNQSLVLLRANRLRIHLCIGDLQGHFNTLHSPDPILHMIYNRYTYSCMTSKRSTCMILNAFWATDRVLWILVFTFVHLPHPLLFHILMLIEVGAQIHNVQRRVIVLFFWMIT